MARRRRRYCCSTSSFATLRFRPSRKARSFTIGSYSRSSNPAVGSADGPGSSGLGTAGGSTSVTRASMHNHSATKRRSPCSTAADHSLGAKCMYVRRRSVVARRKAKSPSRHRMRPRSTLGAWGPWARRNSRTSSLVPVCARGRGGLRWNTQGRGDGKSGRESGGGGAAHEGHVAPTPLVNVCVAEGDD